MLIYFFKKNSIRFLCMLVYFFTISVVAQDQNTITQVDIADFEKSLKEKSLKEKSFDNIIDDFYAHRHSDSLKTAILVAYIRKNFLNATDLNKVAESYFTISAWEDKYDNYAAAIATVDSGLQIAERLANKKLLYLGYTKKGNYQFEKGENDLALINYTKAYEISKETGNIKRQLIASTNVGLIKIQTNDNLGVIDLCHENLAAIESSKDKNFEPIKLEIYLALVKAYINLEQYTEATLYSDIGLALSTEMNRLDSQAKFNAFLGELSSNQGNTEKGHLLFDKAYELIEKAGGDLVFEIFLKLYVGKTYFLENKYDQAIAELRKGEDLIEKHNVDFLSIQELYIYLAKSYLAIENIKESIKYFNKANDIDAKNDKKRAIIHSKITKITLGKLKVEIENIQAKSKQSKLFYGTGITVLVLIIIGLIVFYKKQQQQNKKRFSALMQQLEKQRQQKLQHEKEATQPETQTEVVEIDEKDVEILEKLTEFEQKELFLSNESTLVEVAKKIQTNTTYLSKVINTHKEKSFTSYITDLRVDYAIERLSHDRKFRSFTIGAIAQEIGFKRSESFSKAFKVKTGLYPSYFIKQLEKQQLINNE